MCKVSEFTPNRLVLMQGLVLDFSNYAGLFLYIVLSNVFWNEIFQTIAHVMWQTAPDPY